MNGYQYSCSLCGVTVKGPLAYTCPQCGDQGLLDIQYDYRKVKELGWCMKGNFSAPARYCRLLPLDSEYNDADMPVSVGNAPLIRLRTWEKQFGQSSVSLLDDTREPTASFKDRASVIASLKARELGESVVTCASTGNAGSSMAGINAAFGLSTRIFVPEKAPIAKLTQIITFGATVFRIRGTYDNAYDLCQVVARKQGWYNRSTGYNPVLLEGKKTAAFEIYEKCGVPDRVYVPVGDGCIIAGIYKGFQDLVALGVCQEFPFIVGVQADGSAAYCRAVENGFAMQTVKASTIADSISVDLPRVFSQAIRIAQSGHGSFISVSDSEILNAQKQLAACCGVFAEPAAAAAAAGFIRDKQSGVLSGREKVVLLITGNGLKDVQSALSGVALPEPIEPNPQSVDMILTKKRQE
ncbi:MAG: threonine synthase [Candidatus Wallbacteria bacterium]|nr:threonine synthase [Candidatus Wallbacteria bacterium]